MTARGRTAPVPAQRSATANVRREVPGHLSGAVAVVSDGSGLRHRGRAVDSASVYPVLADYATLIGDLTGLPAHPIAVTATDAEQLATSLRSLPVDIGAIFLTNTDPARARAAQRALREVGGLPVITDQDTTAIALAASVHTTLARAEHAPSVSQVVIAGAEHMPVLVPLLMAVGVGDIISWNEADAHNFPLYRVARRADVVVDLLGGARERAEIAEGSRRAVIGSDDPGCHLLALPGLLTAVVRTPEPVLDVALYRVCALALAACTPPGQLVPTLGDPAVTDHVARAATHTLHHPHRLR